MSKTLNTLEYLVRLNRIAESDKDLQEFVIYGAKQASAEAGDYDLDAENITNSVFSDQINTMAKANPSAMRDITKDIITNNIDDDLRQAGIPKSALSNHQVRELQVLKTYTQELRQDESFKNTLWNARDNILNSVHNTKDGKGLDESIAFSMAFGNGSGVGRKPSDANIIDGMSRSEAVVDLMDRAADANDQYLSARRIPSSSNLGKVVKAGAIAAMMVIGVNYQKIVDTDPVAEYGGQALYLEKSAYDGATAWEMSRNMLDDLGMSTEDADVLANLRASGQDTVAADIMSPGDSVRLRIPSNFEDFKVTPRGQVYNEYGQELIENPLQKYEAEHDYEDEGPSRS